MNLDNLEAYYNGWIMESTDGKVLISGGFIKHYCGSLTNSFVYLSTCKSGCTSELANAFIQKGAKAVVANDRRINTVYTQSVMYTTI